MSREILFRGKRKENGKWVEGYYQQRYDAFENIQHLIFWAKSSAVWEYAEVDSGTVCQYTGHKDDTGERIFEGDIVAFEDITSTESGYFEMDCCGKVGYDEEEACFYVTDRLSAESWEVLGECHIIGNVFDTPELLNQ